LTPYIREAGHELGLTAPDSEAGEQGPRWKAAGAGKSAEVMP
jgi:hypothetical protein